VARALVALGMDLRKRSGDLVELASAVTLAKTEVSYFQGRVEAAKRAKNTEAAVNLGISTKRLLSFIEEAEKLQP
jgi:K+-transporting ATPase c subunit